MSQHVFVYRVMLPFSNPRSGKPYFVNFECLVPSIDDLANMLSAGQIVTGNQLFSRRSSDDRYVEEVFERRRFALGAHGIATIAMPNQRFVEDPRREGEKPAADPALAAFCPDEAEVPFG